MGAPRGKARARRMTRLKLPVLPDYGLRRGMQRVRQDGKVPPGLKSRSHRSDEGRAKEKRVSGTQSPAPRLRPERREVLDAGMMTRS